MKLLELREEKETAEVPVRLLLADSDTAVPETEVTVAPPPMPVPLTDMPIAIPDPLDTVMVGLPDTSVAEIPNVTFPVPVVVLGTDSVTVVNNMEVTVAPAPIPEPLADIPTEIPVVDVTTIVESPETRVAETVTPVLEKLVGGMSHGLP